MRWVIFAVTGIYAFLLVDGLESKSSKVSGKRTYQVRVATALLVAVAAIFAQSSNSLETKLKDSEETVASLEHQKTLAENEVANLKINNAQLEQKLAAATFSQSLASSSFPISGSNGATALCVDGSYSFAASHRGACSHHGGVAEWYR